MPDPLDAAKKALAGANAFTKSVAPTAIAPRTPAPAPASAAPKPRTQGEDIAAGLQARKDNVAAYKAAYPKMHKGGLVKADGIYDLQAGEHVLTGAEAKQARKHALMASGMKSLANIPPMARPVKG